MLIYNPAFDIYHTIFRLIQIITNLKNKEVEVDRLFILDFYLTFPAELLKISLPVTASKYKKYLRKEKNSYERIPNQKRLFMRMQPLQQEALKSLVGYNLIDPELYKNGRVKWIGEKIPTSIINAILKTTEKHKEIIELLTGPLIDIHLNGNGGLKERTNLLEYKYDSV